MFYTFFVYRVRVEWITCNAITPNIPQNYSEIIVKMQCGEDLLIYLYGMHNQLCNECRFPRELRGLHKIVRTSLILQNFAIPVLFNNKDCQF